jgi:hypothetical protein
MEKGSQIISNSAIFDWHYNHKYITDTTQSLNDYHCYNTLIGRLLPNKKPLWTERMISNLIKSESGFKIIGAIMSEKDEKEKRLFTSRYISYHEFNFVRSVISAVTEEDYTYLVEYVYTSQPFSDRRNLDSKTIGNDLKFEICNFRFAQVCKARNLSNDEIANYAASGKLNWKSYPAKLGMLHNHNDFTFNEIEVLYDIIDRVTLLCQKQNKSDNVKRLSHK